MHRILAFSDTHGNIEACVKRIEAIGAFDLIIHAGDILRDCEDLESVYGQEKIEYVLGNNDCDYSTPNEKIICRFGKIIFVTHGHFYGVKADSARVVQRAKQVGADILIFGHTHKSRCGYEEGVLVINPGSGRGWHGNLGNYAVIEIEDNGKVSADILEMN